MIKAILEKFSEKTAQFAADTDGHPENKRMFVDRRHPSAIDGIVTYNTFKVEFRYIVGRGKGPRSVLTAVVSPIAEPLGLSYLIYDLTEQLDPDDYSCYTFGYIPDVEGFEAAFDCLAGKISARLSDIAALFEDAARYQSLKETKIADINAFFGSDIFEQSQDMQSDDRIRYLARAYDMYMGTVLVRYVSVGYNLFLCGDKEGALRHYEGRRGLTAYERRLTEHLRSEQALVKSNEPNFLGGGIAAASGKGQVLPFVLSWLVLACALTPVFYGLYMLIAYLLADGALYSTAFELYNAAFSVLPSAVTALAAADILKSRILRFSKRRGRYAGLFSSGRPGAFVRYGVCTAAALAVIFTMLIANVGVRFYDKTFCINPSISDLRTTEYAYSEIEQVYRYEGAYNAAGRFIVSPGTVIALTDGKKYNITGVVRNADLDKAYAALESYGVTITDVKTLDRIKD